MVAATQQAPWLPCSNQIAVSAKITVDSKQMENECGMISASFPSFFGLGLEDGVTGQLLLPCF